MPPTAYFYAPNQIHNMQQFGPICMQRWPVDPPINLYPSDSRQANYTGYGFTADLNDTGLVRSQALLLRVMRKMMPEDSYNYLLPIFSRLFKREQSEDCLNLNIYAPIGGKYDIHATFLALPT